MSSLPRSAVFYGAVINPQTLTAYQALPNCLLSVGFDGNIDWLEEDVPEYLLQEVLSRHGSSDADIITLKHGEFLMPGFVDTHTHAPQVPNLGSGQQHELLDWLAEVTFPMEAKFKDLDFARRTYEKVVRRIVDSGTTTCCYYGTLHLEATNILVDIIHSYGQRAFVGKCNMDRNCPDDYIEPSADASMEATKAQSSLPGLPSPALARSSLRSGTSARADPSLLVQTHISENEAEIVFTKHLFPECSSYADVYDKHGLLGPRTVLAHAVHLHESEVTLVKQRDAGVSHCPTSNFNLRSGVCPVGKLLDRGIKVGLGTDVSGGFSPSILTAIQHASIASKVVALETPADKSGTSQSFAGRQLSIAALLHLATLGGAQVCGLQSRIGSFAPGKAFDALLGSVRTDAGNPGLWGVDCDAELGVERNGAALYSVLERFFFTGDDRNIRKVYVQGRWIGGVERRQ
ncbi:hypothetical protein EVG20_g8634 [Dentipellis fragilis]|uniref:Amidohydrolase-related domain-containing protein n=1 Tax=Dentipellis fragilis TaxID=205917 RepID=A0A4Y9Y5L5_9AGAM|nr:hypothetical protein EVG20_g8634 [Dentipellis fragilis]